MARFSEEDRATIWELRERGVGLRAIARRLGRRDSSIRGFLARSGGSRPSARQRNELRLSLAEREEISRGLAAGVSLREIAAGLGRSASTVCGELNANGGRCWYRALEADRPRRCGLFGLSGPSWRTAGACAGLSSANSSRCGRPSKISACLAETYPKRSGDAGCHTRPSTSRCSCKAEEC